MKTTGYETVPINEMQAKFEIFTLICFVKYAKISLVSCNLSYRVITVIWSLYKREIPFKAV